MYFDPVLWVHGEISGQVVNVNRVLRRIELWEFRPENPFVIGLEEVSAVLVRKIEKTRERERASYREL